MAKKRGTSHMDLRSRLEALATLTKWQHQLVCALLKDTSIPPSTPSHRGKKASANHTGRHAGRQT